jgi:hypothetical protein
MKNDDKLLKDVENAYRFLQSYKFLIIIMTLTGLSIIIPTLFNDGLSIELFWMTLFYILLISSIAIQNKLSKTIIALAEKSFSTKELYWKNETGYH